MELIHMPNVYLHEPEREERIIIFAKGQRLAAQSLIIWLSNPNPSPAELARIQTVLDRACIFQNDGETKESFHKWVLEHLIEAVHAVDK